MSYTKGPWHVGTTYATHNHPKRFWETSVRSESGYIGIGVGALESESVANARLIAAAPELLEACKEALLWIEAEMAKWDELPGHCGRTASLLQTVINKAEGRP